MARKTARNRFGFRRRPRRNRPARLPGSGTAGAVADPIEGRVGGYTGQSDNDLNGDGQVKSADRDVLILDILDTSSGDADLDGVFNSGDMALVFQVGEYEDDLTGTSTWAEGDWDSDGDVSTADTVLAFQGGGYTNECKSSKIRRQ